MCKHEIFLNLTLQKYVNKNHFTIIFIKNFSVKLISYNKTKLNSSAVKKKQVK